MDNLWTCFSNSSIFDECSKDEKEFDKLNAATRKKVKVGDKVVFAAGLVGRGFRWIREEAEVIEVGQNSVKLKYKKSYDKDLGELWVHHALITDVLEVKTSPIAEQEEIL